MEANRAIEQLGFTQVEVEQARELAETLSMKEVSDILANFTDAHE